MKLAEQLEKCGEQEGCIDHIVMKSKVSTRRKTKFGRNGNGYMPRTRWVNLTGVFRDEELRRDPKYWLTPSKRPIATSRLQSHNEVATAIKMIQCGERDWDEYRGVTGINRERIRLAQVLRDRKVDYDVSYIIGLGYQEIQKQMKVAVHSR